MAIIEGREQVAIHDEGIVAEVANQAERTGSPERLFLDIVVNGHSESSAVTDGCLEQRCEVTQRDRDPLESVESELADHDLHDRHFPEREQRLGIVAVKGRNRVPLPPASRTARIARAIQIRDKRNSHERRPIPADQGSLAVAASTPAFSFAGAAVPTERGGSGPDAIAPLGGELASWSVLIAARCLQRTLTPARSQSGSRLPVVLPARLKDDRCRWRRVPTLPCVRSPHHADAWSRP